MHSALLQACCPGLIALVICCFALVLLVKLCGAKWEIGRLRSLHRCEQGAVQSLSFVLVLPLFIMIVMLIVQISQLMIGRVVLEYAAFATARAASVWIPAEVELLDGEIEKQNVLPDGLTADNVGEDRPTVLSYRRSDLLQSGDANVWNYLEEIDENIETNMFGYNSYKYRKIFDAAALACAAVSPSRDVMLDEGNTRFIPQIGAAKSVYSNMVPASLQNARVPARLSNKISYAYENTVVRISFIDKNTEAGLTYNPRMPIFEYDEEGERYYTGVRDWDRSEVGWQDPVSVTVTHNLALIPGPGRFLAKYIVRADGQPDRVAPRIGRSSGVYNTRIWASATLTNEGFKSVRPYRQMEE